MRHTLNTNSELDPAQQARLFAALGDSTRLTLIDRMGGGAHNSITELGAGLKLSRQGVTKHLRVLEDAGVVSSRRVGRELQYDLQAEALTAARLYLDRVSAQWDDAIKRLRSFVEGVD